MNKSTDSVSPAVTEAVLHAFLRTWGLLRQVQDPYFARFGISASQWGILRVLQRAELKGESGLPLKEVGRRLLIQPSSVTGAIDRLERQGLVRRSSSETDLRVRHLSLTPEAKKLAARILESHAERTKLLFAGLPQQDQASMLVLLQRLEAHLETLVSSLPAPETEGDEKAE